MPELPKDGANMSLSEKIMTVLNLRSQSELKGQPASREPQPQSQVDTGKAAAELAKLFPAAPFLRHLYLADSSGRLLVVSHAERALDETPPDWSQLLQSLVRVNLGGELKRVFLESGNGIVVLLSIAPNRWLIAVCERGASLGTVSVGVGKLIARLIPPQGNGKPAGDSGVLGIQEEPPAEPETPRLRASGA